MQPEPQREKARALAPSQSYRFVSKPVSALDAPFKNDNAPANHRGKPDSCERRRRKSSALNKSLRTLVLRPF